MADPFEQVVIEKMVEGGQGLGTLPDGKKVFVWNALPGEVVAIRVIKQKHSYAEAIAEEIIKPSAERIEPMEPNYLATSPWQILQFDAENIYKKQIVADIFQQAKVNLPDFTITSLGNVRPFILRSDPGRGDILNQTGENDPFPKVARYRNKMEYSFWGDDDGLHLAMHMRGSHGKHIVEGSLLAMSALDWAAHDILVQLQKMQVRAGDLKTIIVRCSQEHDAVAAVYVKPTAFPRLALTKNIQGLRVYHSNPKSPASVRTKLLQEEGDCQLHDMLLGKLFAYDVDSFFQVNVPVFEQALKRIRDHCDDEEIVDMYAGVGSIGLSVASRAVTLVELDPATARMASVNAAAARLDTQVIETSAENALAYITHDKPVIFDPPRAGLHDKVVARALEVRPPKIVYLSCNPVTQARDLAALQTAYKNTYFEAFNFFPRTPHIETLAVLERKA